MEFRDQDVVIAKDYFSSSDPTCLSLYRGEVLLLLNQQTDTTWKAKTAYETYGFIHINNVIKIDLSAVTKRPELVTLDWLPFFMSGTFFFYLRDEKVQFVYNNYGTILQAKLGVSENDRPEDIEVKVLSYIWSNRNILGIYVDDESVIDCFRYLNSGRSLKFHEESGATCRITPTSPRPYIPDWYQGYINRASAHKLLHGKPKGTFIVIKGRTRHAYILSITDGTDVYSIIILEKKGKVRFANTIKEYDSVVDLIEHNFSLPFVFNDQDLPTELYLETWISNKTQSCPEGFESLDPYWTELYLRSLAEGTEKQCCIRLMVVGHAGVGKTTLTRNLMGKEIDDVESTNGIDVHVKTITVETDGNWVDSETVDKDSPFLQRIARVSKSITDKKDVQSHKVDEGHIELSQNQVKPERTFTKEINGGPSISALADINTSEAELLYSRTNTEPNSSLTGQNQISLSNEHMRTVMMLHKTLVNTELSENVSIWDFGGQFIFYATHQLFHSPSAIYLLVLDLSKDLKDVVDFGSICGSRNPRDVQSFILFWLHSIHTFVGSNSGEPPVILVGTHRDKLDGSDENKDNHAEEYFERIRKMTDGSPLLYHIQPEQFMLDNLRPREASVELLRETVINVAKRQSYWNQEIPAKWIPLEKALDQLAGVDHITLEQVCAIDSSNEIPITSKDEIQLFLMYHHFQGKFVYFNEEQLSNHIILNPQWLIDAFKCIITSRRFCKVRPSLRYMWEELESKAILRNVLIEEAWTRDDTYSFMAYKEMILRFLVRLGIISKCRKIDETTNQVEELDYYLVPSLLPVDDKPDTIHTLFANTRSTLVAMVFQFENAYISPTIYHRTTAAAIGRWAIIEHSGRRLLCSSYGVYRLDEHHAGIIRFIGNRLELDVLNLCCEPVKSQCADSFRRCIASVLKHELNKNQSNNDNHFTLMFRCSCNKNNSGDLISVDMLLKGCTLPCLNTDSIHKIDTLCAYHEWFNDTAIVIKEHDESLLRPISEAQIGLVARAIGFNWKLLGISLGVSEAELDKLQMDFPSSPVVQKRHMLLAWQRSVGDQATIDALIKEMEINKAVEIDWDVIKDMIDSSDTHMKTVY